MNSMPLILIALLFGHAIPSRSQGPQPIQWTFACDMHSQSVVILRGTATLAPRWHIYSQFLKDGGPLPTRFTFEPSEVFQPLGAPGESGTGVSFYDSLYEMNITWYSERVTFSQALKLVGPSAAIKGTITYMTCNENQCIPGSTTFHLPVTVLRRAP